MSLSDLLSVSYSGVTLECEKFAASYKPTLDKGVRVGTDVEISGTAYVEGSTYAEATAALATAIAAMNRSGGTLTINGPSGAVVPALASADCLGGGPHVECKATHAVTALRYELTFTAKAAKPDDGSGGGNGGGDVVDKFEVTTKLRPDKLRQISRKGTITGKNTANKLTTAIYPAWQLLYKLPGWVVEADYTASTDTDQSECQYTISAVELSGELPTAPFGGAVDGSYQKSVDRDEQFRKTTNHSYDLLTAGSPVSLVDTLRPAAPAIVLKETVSIEQVRERRVKATFVTLESGSGTPLMNFNQTVSIEHYRPDGKSGKADVCEVKEYPGAEPVVIVKPKSIRRVIQSGSMICTGGHYMPPNPLSSGLLAPPTVTFEQLNSTEFKTSWSYQLYDAKAYLVPNPVDAGFKFQGPINRTVIDLTPATVPGGTPPPPPPAGGV